MPSNILKKYRDKKTLQRLKNKDAEAFISVYDNYVNDLYRFIYFKIGKDEEAKDLTSMVFTKAWNHIQNNSLTDSKTLRALIYKIARNAIIDHYRQGSAKIESLDNYESPPPIVDEKIDIEKDLDDKLELERLISYVLELKEEYREVIVLRFISELELDEISSVTGKSKGNIRVILHRALNSLKSMMKDDKEFENRK